MVLPFSVLCCPDSFRISKVEPFSLPGSVAPSVTWANDAKYDQQMDLDQEDEARKKFHEERENEQFPDEVDTPEDLPARLRFARLVRIFCREQ